MGAKERSIKDYGWHFRVFSIYLKIDYEACQKSMKDFFKSLPETVELEPDDLEDKIDSWWDERRKPQRKELAPLNGFFKDLAKASKIEWNDDWLKLPMEELKEIEPLVGAVKKFEEPLAIARKLRESYRNSDLLKKIVDDYCHKCFFIYRVHTASGKLVRDVLRIQGHDEEKIFCKYYQYTSHKPSYPQWKNIKIFRGNVFFNHDSLDITFVSEIYVRQSGPQYGNIVFPPLLEHSERIGMLMALTDESHYPAASAILVREANIEHPLELEKIGPYVRKMKACDGRNVKNSKSHNVQDYEEIDAEDFEEIMGKINGKMIVIKQDEKWPPNGMNWRP